MGSQHPSPNVKALCNFETLIWLEIITSRDAKSACFQGSRTSCREIMFGLFRANFGQKRSHHVMNVSCWKNARISWPSEGGQNHTQTSGSRRLSKSSKQSDKGFQKLDKELDKGPRTQKCAVGVSFSALFLRNPEKGAFARGESRKFVANCTPNLRKITGISFRTSEEGCAKLSQICREFESQFRTILCKYPFSDAPSLRLLNALNSEDRGLKVRFCFSLATIAFERESAQMSQILSSQGKNAPSNPYPHYLVHLATSRNKQNFLIFKLFWSRGQEVRGTPLRSGFFRVVCRRRVLGQDYYQTFARTRVEGRFSFCPLVLQTQENKQNMARNGTFLFRKILLVSVKFVSAILGPEMAAPILWTPGKMRPFCRKNHFVHKIPRFRGGFLGGGGEVPILFLWARGFFWSLSARKPGCARNSGDIPVWRLDLCRWGRSTLSQPQISLLRILTGPLAPTESPADENRVWWKTAPLAASKTFNPFPRTPGRAEIAQPNGIPDNFHTFRL